MIVDCYAVRTLADQRPEFSISVSKSLPVVGSLTEPLRSTGILEHNVTFRVRVVWKVEGAAGHRGANISLTKSSTKLLATPTKPKHCEDEDTLALSTHRRVLETCHLTTMAEPAPVPAIVPPPNPPTDRPLHTLPPPFSQDALTPITQGAEALVYKTTYLTPTTPAVVKYRPPKPYRHPTLDKRLTKSRLLAEARSLVRVKREGVNVPGVLGCDADAGWLVLEYVNGRTIRKVLDSWAEEVKEQEQRVFTEGGDVGQLARAGGSGNDEIMDLMGRVGREVGKLHELGVCHGDLTTSNLMLRVPEGENTEGARPTGRPTTSAMREAAMNGEEPPSLEASQDAPTHQSLAGEIFLIDFGLTSSTIQDEDRAVDLYVLERAFSATHPAAEHLFHEVLDAYRKSYKGAKSVLKRLEGVRMRGRKRMSAVAMLQQCIPTQPGARQMNCYSTKVTLFSQASYTHPTQPSAMAELAETPATLLAALSSRTSTSTNPDSTSPSKLVPFFELPHDPQSDHKQLVSDTMTFLSLTSKPTTNESTMPTDLKAVPDGPEMRCMLKVQSIKVTLPMKEPTTAVWGAGKGTIRGPQCAVIFDMMIDGGSSTHRNSGITAQKFHIHNARSRSQKTHSEATIVYPRRSFTM
ncbi:hypothetical protein OPT61_g6630 [Boeremia exigua]|uniref:Uncharacterized protein n=1 Tax=Boeremia exigua TaxID=749465 RepID=A0ACC2I666_9PLEO|nr:hypothetical protein OPT61_g6630 [Boeremia exigua]